VPLFCANATYPADDVLVQFEGNAPDPLNESVTG
jgi:hypothetical protein